MRRRRRGGNALTAHVGVDLVAQEERTSAVLQLRQAPLREEVVHALPGAAEVVGGLSDRHVWGDGPLDFGAQVRENPGRHRLNDRFEQSGRRPDCPRVRSTLPRSERGHIAAIKPSDVRTGTRGGRRGGCHD